MEGEDAQLIFIFIFFVSKKQKKRHVNFLSNSIHIINLSNTQQIYIFTSWKQRAHTSILHCLEKEEDVVRAEEYTNHRRGWLYRLPRGHSLRKEVPALQGESLYRLKSGADV